MMASRMWTGAGGTGRRWGVWAALAAGAGLRAVFVWLHPRFGGDTLVYGDLATNLLRHHVFGLTEEVVRPTLIRLPGYPLLLAACFAVFGVGNYLAVVWVQVGLDLVSCGLVGAVARRLWGERAGLAALWLAALCPFTANYAAVPLTETGSLLCVAAGLYALERWVEAWRAGGRGWRWLGALGGSLAWAVLLRPEQGLLAAALTPAVVWVSWREGGRERGGWERLLPAVVVCVLVAAPLGVWGWRNWRVFHVVEPLAPRNANDPGEVVPVGFQRWYRSWGVEFTSTVEVYWAYDGSALAMKDLPARAMDTAAERAKTAALVAAYDREQSATPELDARFGELAAERVRAHPVRQYVEMPVLRELDMWLRPRTELLRIPLAWWRFAGHPWESGFALGYGLLDAAYLGLGVAGVGAWWRRRRVGSRATVVVVAGLGFVALRSALLLTLDNSEPRYTLECFPVVMVMAAALWGRRERGGG